LPILTTQTGRSLPAVTSDCWRTLDSEHNERLPATLGRLHLCFFLGRHVAINLSMIRWPLSLCRRARVLCNAAQQNWDQEGREQRKLMIRTTKQANRCAKTAMFAQSLQSSVQTTFSSVRVLPVKKADEIKTIF
jgi:hypothetical protein